MKTKRKYVIDRQFQFKKSFAVVGFMSIVLMFVMISVGVFISINNDKIEANNLMVVKNTEETKEILELQQIIFINLSSIPPDATEEIDLLRAEEMNKDYNRSIKKLNQIMATNQRIVELNSDILTMNGWLAGVLPVTFFVGIVILHFFMIRQTHRISGPIFVMTRYINELLDGKAPEMKDLRKKDDFKDFYDLLRQLVVRFLKQSKSNSA